VNWKIATAAVAAAAWLGGMTLAGGADAQDRKQRWKLASAFPGALAQIGPGGKRVAENITKLSEGSLEVKFHEPGALVPALEVLSATSVGSVDAGWTAAGFWTGRWPAAAFFSAVPFGPAAPEYIAWFYYGGGKQIYDELYGSIGVKGTMCFLIPPETGGWYRKEIKTIEDFRGMKLRYPGLAGRVLDKVGAATQLLAPGDIYPALELGTIDGTEFSTPVIDLGLGFYRVAKYNYYPGWHQPGTMLELIVNQKKWEALTDTQRLLVETVCGDQMRLSLAEGEATQFKALAELQSKGAQIGRFPPEVLAKLEEAWRAVVEEENARDPQFKKTWESLDAFRKQYASWRDLGYLR